MNKNMKFIASIFALLLAVSGCQDEKYSFGKLTAPSNVVIKAEIAGKNASNPNGDGSGDVTITITADNALAYNVDYGDKSTVKFEFLPTGTVAKKYTTLGVNTYRITALVYGMGGTSSTVTKDITVRSDFTVNPTIVTNLTGGSSKTWAVDPSVAGHFGVGPWTGSAKPDWWQAGINEKVGCCNCFYSASFVFTKVTADNSYTLQVKTPDGAFTKTGSLTRLPGIPSTGGEACYSYGGATGAFTFGPATSGIPASTPTTSTSIYLSNDNLFIGYGSLQSEYEILKITATELNLRIQGTETGNAWYLKLKAL